MLPEHGAHPEALLQDTQAGDRGGAAGYCQPRGQHQQALKSGELVDCPQQIAMVVESPRGLRRLGDCSPRAVMAVKTPLGLRRAVSCSQQAGMAV